jgi:hypothetical protein
MREGRRRSSARRIGNTLPRAAEEQTAPAKKKAHMTDIALNTQEEPLTFDVPMKRRISPRAPQADR